MFNQPTDIKKENHTSAPLFPIPMRMIAHAMFTILLLLETPVVAGPASVGQESSEPHSGRLGEIQKNTPSITGVKRRISEAPLRAGRYGASAHTSSNSNARPLSLSRGSDSPSDAVDKLLEGNSISMGSVTHGRLIGGVEMNPKSEAWHFIPAATKRRTNFATRPLVHILQKSAESIVADHQGPKLLIGNLSFEQGGDLPWSVSHNSGRDADVAFYATHEDGSPVEHNHFIRFNRRGKGTLAGKTVYFDAARNWAFVRTFLMSEDIQVQWMFLASPLRRKLLKHAEKIEEEPELIARATKILKQPSDSSPHRDHFHIRLYCGLHEVLQGCRNTGATWEWVSDYQTELGHHIEEQEKQLAEGGKLEKLEALKNLKLVGHRPSTDTLLTLIKDDNTTPNTQTIALSMLLSYGGVALDSLEGLLSHPNTSVRKRIIKEIGNSRKKRVVPLLIEQFSKEERDNRDAIRLAFAKVTNHAFKVPEGDGPAHLRLQAYWRQWYSKNKSDDWEQWIREGFEKKGADFEGKMIRKRSIPILIRYTKKKNHLGLNANRMINKIIGRSMGSKDRSYSKWKSWWRKKYRKYGHRSSRL